MNSTLRREVQCDAAGSRRKRGKTHNRWIVAMCAAAMAACSSAPPTPDWQMNAKGAMERAQSAYLSGNTRAEADDFAKARSEVAATGRVDLLARLELARCATRVASLVFEACAGYEALAQDAPVAERAYAAYLDGRAGSADAALLPEQHRAVAAAADAAAAPDLKKIADPLSRLVAAGVSLRMQRADPAVIAEAITTASDQGWRRPLLAWLGVQAQRAEAAGDTEEAARIRRRIALAGDGNSRP